MADEIVAVRLNRLLASVRAPGCDRPYTAADVVDGIRRRGGRTSAGYLSQLRSGMRQHVSPRIAEDIADFFGVEPAYVLGNDSAYCAKVDEDLAWMRMAHEPTVRTLIESIVALPRERQQEILDLVDGIRDQTT